MNRQPLGALFGGRGFLFTEGVALDDFVCLWVMVFWGRSNQREMNIVVGSLWSGLMF